MLTLIWVGFLGLRGGGGGGGGEIKLTPLPPSGVPSLKLVRITQEVGT